MTRQERIELANRYRAGTLMETLKIEFTDLGEAHLEARMPVEPAVLQPMGILHGGATAALAESVGSMASAMVLMDSGRRPVGLELAINHIRQVTDGWIHARAKALHLGRSTHLWQIPVRDAEDRLVAHAMLTLMVIEAKDRSAPAAPPGN